MPLSPGSSHSLSTSPNFNPFSPLSPYQANKELDDNDQDSHDDGAQADSDNRHQKRVVYSRDVLLKFGRHRPLSSWPKPRDMAPLHEWFGNANPKFQMDDPAIVSMGQGSGRKAAGYDEGFGFGGGIGGKGIGRGHKPPGGNGQNDTRARRHHLDTNGLPVHNKDAFSGQMGKFSVKAPGERLKPSGNEEVRISREDWRRGGPPPPPRQAQDRRQWVNHHEETSQPAWMDDHAEIDPAIVVERDSTPFSFGTGNDPIAAHKRMMRGTGDHKKAEPQLVPFFAGQEPLVGKAPKAPKQVNAADYLLPGKASAKATPVSTQVEPPVAASQSRSQRWFLTPQPGLPSHAPPNDRQASEPAYATQAPQPSSLPQSEASNTALPAPAIQSPPPTSRNQAVVQPPQDHTSKLMGLLKSPPPSSPVNNLQLPPQRQQSAHTTSPPPGMFGARAAYTSPPPLPSGMMLDHRSPEYSRNYGPPPLPPPSFPPHFTDLYPSHPSNYNPPPGFLPASTQGQMFPHPHQHGSLPPHAMTQNTHRPDYPYGLHPGTLPPPPGSHLPPPQLGNPQQNLLATLYGNMHHGHP